MFNIKERFCNYVVEDANGAPSFMKFENRKDHLKREHPTYREDQINLKTKSTVTLIGHDFTFVSDNTKYMCQWIS